MTTLEKAALGPFFTPEKVLVATKTVVSRDVAVDICCALALAESTLLAAGLKTEAGQVGGAFELAESVLFIRRARRRPSVRRRRLLGRKGQRE
jgi:hypothetical protein